MSTKEILLEVAEKLPVDATLVDAIYELEFRQAVQDGLASLDRGEGVPLEEALIIGILYLVARFAYRAYKGSSSSNVAVAAPAQ